MFPIQYFLPGETIAEFSNKPDVVLAAFGLSYLELRRENSTAAELPEFPAAGLGAGLLLTSHVGGDPVDDARFKAAESVVRKFETPRPFAMAVRSDDLPGPVALQKRYVSDGYDVADQNLHQWRIAIAFSPNASRLSLPSNWVFDDAGQAISKPKPNQASYWELAGRLAERWRGEGEPLSRAELATAAVEILGVNYRISKRELMLLADAGRFVIDDDFALAVSACCCDKPLADELSKKNDDQEAIRQGDG